MRRRKKKILRIKYIKDLTLTKMALECEKFKKENSYNFNSQISRIVMSKKNIKDYTKIVENLRFDKTILGTKLLFRNILVSNI